MNKDNVTGKAKDIAGRVERQVGEWTDDPKKQAEGAAKQVEGKVQKAWGDLKDAGNRAKDDVRGQAAHDDEMREEGRREQARKDKDGEAA